MQKPVEVTIRVYECTSEPGYMYDVYDHDLATALEDAGEEDPISLDGGVHTGNRFEDAIQSAADMAKTLIEQGMIANNTAKNTITKLSPEAYEELSERLNDEISLTEGSGNSDKLERLYTIKEELDELDPDKTKHKRKQKDQDNIEEQKRQDN